MNPGEVMLWALAILVCGVVLLVLVSFAAQTVIDLRRRAKGLPPAPRRTTIMRGGDDK